MYYVEDIVRRITPLKWVCREVSEFWREKHMAKLAGLQAERQG